MIVLTRLNGTRFSINADLIARIEEHPDTTVTLVDGSRYVVREAMAEVVELAEEYKARVLARVDAQADRPQLELLDGGDPPDAAVTPFPAQRTK